MTDTLWQDLRFSMRLLGRSPRFTVAVVLTLALGVGANAAIFSVVNAVLLRQLPFHDPGRLVWIWSVRPDRDDHPFTVLEYIDYRDQNRTLDRLAAYGNWNANLTGSGDAERIQGIRISANAFEMLGVEAVAGRLLLPADDTPGSPRVVVLGYGLWQRHFGGDPGLIGKTISLNSDSYTVAGILPPHFIFSSPEAELAVPLVPDTDPWRKVRGSINFLRFMGRLKPGVTREQAQEEMNAICARLREQYPVDYSRKVGVKLVALHDRVVGDFGRPLQVLLGAVGLVLLIACANLANLFLARAATRQKEIAIRTALGATRARLVRQLLTESGLLALLGGGLGLALASWGIPVLLMLGPANLPRAGEVSIDGHVLAFTLGVSLLAGLLFGLAPASLASRSDLNQRMKTGRNRARGLLVVSEITLALILLIGAGLLMKSFQRLENVAPGFRTGKLLVARLSLPKNGYPKREALASFYDQLKPRIQSLPGVQAVSMVSIAPLGQGLASADFAVEGRPPVSAKEVPEAQYRIAAADYFSAMGIPLLAGREFSERDTPSTTPVVIINETLARKFFPQESPIGRRLLIEDNSKGARPLEIVGVAGDVKLASLEEKPNYGVYLPLRQIHEELVLWLRNNQYWMVRTASDPLTLARAFRRELQAVDRDVAASSVKSMDQYLAASVAPRRFNLFLLEVFGAAALLLAATGIYGVVSYSVTRRTREIGIRMTLGAKPAGIANMIVRQGMALSLAGVAAGLLGAWAATRVMQSLLFGVSATDPLVFAGVAVLFTGTAFLASYLPAKRAARVNPLLALREE